MPCTSSGTGSWPPGGVPAVIANLSGCALEGRSQMFLEKATLQPYAPPTRRAFSFAGDTARKAGFCGPLVLVPAHGIASGAENGVCFVGETVKHALASSDRLGTKAPKDRYRTKA